MPSSRAARMIATRVPAGSRSNVRHEPSDITETSRPEEPSGRVPSILPPLAAFRRLKPYHLAASAARRTDPDGLDVAELTDALDEQLPAEPGGLHAAERQLRVGGHVAVDEHHPGDEVPGEPGLFRLVVGPRVRAEPELGAVGELNRRVDVRRPVQRGDRAEPLPGV